MLRWVVNLVNNISISSDKYNWKQIPPYPIVSIELYLPNKKIIVFEGFEKYLIVKTEYYFFKSEKNKLADTINVLGKKKNEVCQISYHRKGHVFQCKNMWGEEWKPLIIKTFPKRDKTEKKRFELQYSKPIKTDHSLWHHGVWLPKAKVFLKKP